MKKKKEEKNIFKNNKELIVLLSSFIFLLILGISLTYNFDFKENYNLLFDSDTARVLGDATEIYADHSRLDVHPLFVILVQPLCFLLTGIVQNKILAIIILSSLVSSLSVMFIYKIMRLVCNNEKINLLITLIYCLSFSNIIFTAGIETYNFAALFLIILFYILIKYLREKNIDSNKLIVLSLLGLMSLSFTITNFIIYLIILFVLWIFKKINIKKSIIIVIIPLVLLVGLSFTQKIIWQNTPIILKINVMNEKNNYAKFSINKTNIKNVIENDYINSIIGSNPELKTNFGINYNNVNYQISFTKTNIINLLFIGIFYLLIIFLVVHNFKDNLSINIGLLLALGFNSVFHLVYGNSSTFLYSMHFLYLIILLLGINLAKEKNDKIRKYSIIFLILFTIYEFLINTKIFIIVLKLVKEILNTNYLVSNLGLLLTIFIEILIILFITLFSYFIVKQIKNIKKNKELGYIKIGVFSLIIILTFISLENTTPSRFLFIPLKGISKEIIPKDRSEYLEKDFKDYFSKELISLKEYENEFIEFSNNYDNENVQGLNWFDYYYFGLGNRRKLYFKGNDIIDIDTSEVLYSFNIKESLIIPNLYMVIIETEEKDFIKIYEDNYGVHINKNGKDEIIKETENYIELFQFDNQKYKNIKKVLYGDILFNIKNSVITPNIIVYKNPWYRDAAITSMVLKQTNNTDLIKEWVSSITEIYDKQNAGIEEADNLGELLYILSTQEEQNQDLIYRIEEEAEKIATSNPNGYYLYGKTDFGDMHLYQNLWYKLGIESVGREFKYDLSIIPEDSYSSTAWWSDYKVKSKNFQVADFNYPYLNIAAKHKLGTGKLTLNKNLYPLSWESNASQAIYENYASFDNHFNSTRTSPIHSWTASELLLFMLDETADLDFK